MKKINQSAALFFVIAVSVTLVSCSKSSSSSSNSSVTVSTLVGSGSSGNTNGTGTAADFTFPSAIVAINYAGTNDLFVGDFGNSLIRTVNISSGATGTYAGTGISGFANGAALSAEFNGPANIAFDASGDLFISDEENNMIREVTTSGNTITFAGTGTAGLKAGPVATAQLNHPEGIVIDASNNMYIADLGNNVIRKINISTGTISTFAGTGAAGLDNGATANATFNEPYGMALDAAGNVYVTDILNNCIRKITVSTSTVSTFAGTGAKGFSNGAAASATFNQPLGCIFDSGGNMYVSDTYNNVIRKISASGNVTTFAGTGAQGMTNGSASTATFNFPIGLAISGNAVFVADTHNNVIRKITIG